MATPRDSYRARPQTDKHMMHVRIGYNSVSASRPLVPPTDAVFRSLAVGFRDYTHQKTHTVNTYDANHNPVTKTVTTNNKQKLHYRPSSDFSYHKLTVT